MRAVAWLLLFSITIVAGIAAADFGSPQTPPSLTTQGDGKLAQAEVPWTGVDMLREQRAARLLREVYGPRLRELVPDDSLWGPNPMEDVLPVLRDNLNIASLPKGQRFEDIFGPMFTACREAGGGAGTCARGIDRLFVSTFRVDGNGTGSGFAVRNPDTGEYFLLTNAHVADQASPNAAVNNLVSLDLSSRIVDPDYCTPESGCYDRDNDMALLPLELPNSPVGDRIRRAAYAPDDFVESCADERAMYLGFPAGKLLTEMGTLVDVPAVERYEFDHIGRTSRRRVNLDSPGLEFRRASDAPRSAAGSSGSAVVCSNFSGVFAMRAVGVSETEVTFPDGDTLGTPTTGRIIQGATLRDNLRVLFANTNPEEGIPPELIPAKKAGRWVKARK